MVSLRTDRSGSAKARRPLRITARLLRALLALVILSDFPLQPLLVVCGALDKMVPATHCVKAFNVIGGPKNLYIMPNGSHQRERACFLAFLIADCFFHCAQ